MYRLKKILKELFPYTRKNWSIFILCILISCFFWLFLTYSGTFESELKFKILYKDFPKNKILINEPVSEITLKVKGRGFDLLKQSVFGLKNEIELSSDNFVLVQKNTLFCYTLNSKEKSRLIKNKISLNFSIVNFPSEKIDLFYDDVVRKKVAVVPSVKILNDTNLYQISEKKFSLYSIEIKGSKTLISLIKQIETEQIIVQQPRENTSVFLPIRRAKGVLEMFPDSIKMDIKVEPIQQFSLEIQLICSDCPSNIQLKLFPIHAKVNFNCSQKEFAKIKKGDFKLIVDYDEINNDSEKLFIQLQKFPKFVSNIKITPAKADYLIRLK